jgi:hypothetical protein
MNNMKKVILGGIAAIAIAALAVVNVSFGFNKTGFLANLTDIEAYASGEGTSTNDEKNVCFQQACANGTNCECTGCEKGSTDCTPTCLRRERY